MKPQVLNVVASFPTLRRSPPSAVRSEAELPEGYVDDGKP